MKSAFLMVLMLGPSVLVSCGDQGATAQKDGVDDANSSASDAEGNQVFPPVNAGTTSDSTTPRGGGIGDTAEPSTDGRPNPLDTSGVPSTDTVPSVEQTNDVNTTPGGAQTSDLSEGTAGDGTTDRNTNAQASSSDPDAGVDVTDETSSGGDTTGTDSDESTHGEMTGNEDENTSQEVGGEIDDTGDCNVSQPSGSVIGYGAATTGGGNATPVVVSTFGEAEAALSSYRDAFKAGTQSALVLRYTGSFDFSTITDVCRQHTLESRILQIKEMENVTFEGASGSSANFGIKINRAKNVIVRNMTMGLLQGGGDSDAITIEGNGTNGDVEHVWLDHNELFSSTKDDCDGAGDTEFDGLIDIKKGARYITISYNYIHDHQKTGLLGHSDSDDVERYVTFHHNWYNNVVSRTPLHRFGYVHLFNNYYNQITSSGINVRMGGVALIEANYFENATNPVTSRYSDEVGYWDLRDNYVGDNITWTAGSDTLANAENWQSTTTFPASELTYSYTPDPARCVKQIVMANAGAKLSL